MEWIAWVLVQIYKWNHDPAMFGANQTETEHVGFGV